MNNPCIVVVGSSNIDMIAYAQRLPEKGETVYGDSFALGFGGKGANQAVMASRLGAKVYMVNTLGDDVFGTTTLANYQEQGIDISYIARASGSSGVAPIWVEPDGTNRIIIVPGANNEMTTEQAINAIESIPNIAVVIGQLEIPQAVTAAAFAAARAKGIPTILNPAPYVPLIPALINSTEWLIPNESEFAAFHPQRSLPESDAIIQELADLLGINLVVTLGESGAALCKPHSSVQRIPAPKVNAIDSTGAGDAFVGAFAYGLASGMDEIVAIKLGCACASDSVTRKGTQSSYPSREQASGIVSKLG